MPTKERTKKKQIEVNREVNSGIVNLIETISSLSLNDLNLLEDHYLQLTTTNCWWAEYSLRVFVLDVIADAKGKYKEEAAA